MEQFICEFCEKFFPADPFNTFCPECREPLLVFYPSKKKKIDIRDPHPLKKFRDFLPFESFDSKIDLGEGNTPLTPCRNISKTLSLPQLFAKNEMLNPTGSFKDRGTRTALQKALDMKISRIGTVSTGNMAVSTAAYGARAGLATHVLIKSDVSREKLISAGIHGARLLQVEADYGDLFRMSFKSGKKHSIYFMNSVDPYRIEGYKITGFEIYGELKATRPVYIFVPVSSGGHLIGLIKAYRELHENVPVPHFPVFVGIQAQGCSPLAKAFDEKARLVKPIPKVQTVAQSITNPDPPGGNLALKWIRGHHGALLSVPDQAILEAQETLASQEGLFTLPAGATALAGIIQWRKQHPFPKDARLVMVLTGTGLKNVKAVDSSRLNLQSCTLEDLDHSLEVN